MQALNLNKKAKKSQMREKSKQAVSLLLVLLTVFNLCGLPVVLADENHESEPDKYPYAIFASSEAEGAITINTSSFNMNGNMATNGSIHSAIDLHYNGKCFENAETDEFFIFDKLDSIYFNYSGTNSIEIYSEDCEIKENNINSSIPMIAYENLLLQGNSNLNCAVKSYRNLNITGENININNTVIMSKYGDITISGQNVSIVGLIYAPFGNISISAQNINLNNVIIIAESVSLNGESINVNYNTNMAKIIGNVSEELDLPYYEYEYMPDTDGDTLPDIVEKKG